MSNIFLHTYLNNCFQPIKSNNIILQFAPNLCTPQNFMNKVRNDINSNFDYENTNILTFKYTLNQIISISGKQLKNKEKFTKYLCQIKKENSQFCLYVIFCPCINQIILKQHLLKIENINNTKIKNIINIFQNNKSLPGCTFSNFPINKKDDIIICLNSSTIKTQSKFEITLNHQLEHYFDKYIHLDEDTNDFNRDLTYLFKDIQDVQNILNTNYVDLKNILIQLGYINQTDKFNTYDFIQHMFFNDEFYPMCADLSNTFMFSLKNSKLSPNEKLNKILSMCNKNYILSDNFQKLYPAIQEMILFLYINKIISPNKRYKICLDTLKEQFKDNLKEQPFLLRTKNILKDFINKFKGIKNELDNQKI